MKMTGPTSTICFLTSVALEIRLQIYSYALRYSSIVILKEKTCLDQEAALLFTCKTIYDEARSSYYDYATYSLQYPYVNLGDISSYLPKELNCKNIRFLEVNAGFSRVELKDLMEHMPSLQQLTFRFDLNHYDPLGRIHDGADESTLGFRAWTMAMAGMTTPVHKGVLRCEGMFENDERDFHILNIAELLHEMQTIGKAEGKAPYTVILKSKVMDKRLWYSSVDCPRLDVQVEFDSDTNVWTMCINDSEYHLLGYALKKHLSRDFYYDKYCTGIWLEPDELLRWERSETAEEALVRLAQA